MKIYSAHTMSNIIRQKWQYYVMLLGKVIMPYRAPVWYTFNDGKLEWHHNILATGVPGFWLGRRIKSAYNVFTGRADIIINERDGRKFWR